MFNLEAIWNDREFNNPPQFYNWFVEHCMESVKETMLKPLRIAARLGNPPLPFYTNEVESQNNVIKQQLSYRAQELPKFVESMRKMIENQRKDIGELLSAWENTAYLRTFSIFLLTLESSSK